MSQVNVGVADKAFHDAMRVAGAYSYGSLVMPYDETAQWGPLRARRVPPLKQWILERENFEQKVVEGYTEMEDGAIRQLVAGTGVGKSSTMPYAIAAAMSVSGLVLVPNNVLPVMSMHYLTRKFAGLGGLVKVKILRSAHATNPEVGPCVYYSSAVDFLARLARRPTFLTDIGIDFIFLDESHETRPDYTVFKYIKQVGILGSVKIFFGTATAAADVNMEAGGIHRTVQAKEPSLFSVVNPAMLSHMSPLYYGNICDKTLVFVADDTEAKTLTDYYDMHDVPVMAHLMETGDKKLADIPVFLAANTLCVLVVNALFQTGFTLDVDSVVCTGYVSELVADFEENRMVIKKRPVTQAERTQRMGRVGRYKPGKGYYADVEVSPPLRENSNEKALYTFLWCKVFRISMNEPEIAMYQELTGDITPYAAALLLNSRVHPYLMLPYVANDGFFDRWGKVLRYVLYSAELHTSEESNADRVELWKSYSTGPVDYAQSPIQYKCAVQFPKDWAVIPAIAYMDYTRQADIRGYLGLSSRSVISAVSTSARSRRGTSGSGHGRARSSVLPTSYARESVATLPEYSNTRLPRYSSEVSVAASTVVPSVRTVRPEPEPVVNVPSIRELQAAYSYMSVEPRVDVPQPSANVDPVASSVQTWREQVPPSPRLVSGRRQSVSESSSEREEIALKQVDPERYANFKLYPMDPTIFAEFVKSESVTRDDHRRVSALLTGKRDFSALADDSSLHHGSQHVYFTSVLRVHNSALSRKLQITANVRPGMFSRMLGSIDGDLEQTKVQILSTVRLLKACALQSFYVGVDRRSVHASRTPSSVVTPVYTEYEAQAKIMLSFGDPVVVKDINRVCRTAAPILIGGDEFTSGRCVANAWHFGSFLFTVAHSCEEHNKETWPEGALAVHSVDYEQDVIVFTTVGNGDMHYMRHAKPEESVYVVYYDQTQQCVTVLGVFDLYGAGDPLIMDFMLTHGCSGALVLSTEDGAVLGMYRGEYSVGSAWVIPSVYIKDMIYL